MFSADRKGSLQSAATANPLKRKSDTGSRKQDPKSKRRVTSWNTVFYGIMKDPAAHPNEVATWNDSAIVIRDKYPKSVVHLLGLLMPLEKSPKDPRDLRKSHLPALRTMQAMLKECIDAEVASKGLTGSKARIRYGFHRAPSMLPMHLHGISQDFDSPSLKVAKHWNSFTTDFFVPYEAVVDILDKAKDDEDSARKIEEYFGSAEEAEKKYFKLPLQCHICHATLKNMPALKTHIKECELEHDK